MFKTDKKDLRTTDSRSSSSHKIPKDGKVTKGSTSHNSSSGSFIERFLRKTGFHMLKGTRLLSASTYSSVTRSSLLLHGSGKQESQTKTKVNGFGSGKTAEQGGLGVAAGSAIYSPTFSVTEGTFCSHANAAADESEDLRVRSQKSSASRRSESDDSSFEDAESTVFIRI